MTTFELSETKISNMALKFKSLEWVEASDGIVPNGAVVGGEDEGEVR